MLVDCLTAKLIEHYNYSFIYPYLHYCNHVWGNTHVTYLQKLHILQKLIVRIIAGVKPREHTAPIVKELEIQSIFDINAYVISKFMYEVYHHEV